MTNVFSAPLTLMVLLGLLLPVHNGNSAFAGSGPAPTLPNVSDKPSAAPVATRSRTDTPPAKGLLNYLASSWAEGNRIIKVSPDPIRFLIQSDKRQITLNEEVNLTITAQLLNITPNQLFYVPGSNAYTLKLILPPGFEQTGGDFTDNVVGNLSYATQPVLTYHIKGHFKSVTAGTSFRLLRSHGQANDQSLFAEKSAVTLETLSPEKALSQRQKTTAASTNPTDITLYVVTDAPDRGAARAAAPAYQGFLDYAACDAVSGWIINTNDLRKSQEVDIYVNGVKAATVMADQHRRDVASAFGVNDFSEYGYVWVIPDYYKSNTPLMLSVRPAETNTELVMSPRRTDVCPGTGTPPATTPTSTTTTTPPSTSTTGPSTPTITPPVTTTTTPPATATVTPPVTTTTGGALTMLAPTYNCTSGAITFNTSGGDGTPIRYRATGITGWTTDPNQYLDQGSRVNADTPPFTIYVEQSGKTITYIWSRQATCDGTTPPTNPTNPTNPTTPPVTTPPAPVTVTPPTGSGCAASINTISYLWDGGNNSISIRINASSGTPQIKLAGPTTIEWTNTITIENDVRYWALANMNPGNYTLSVRQSGDGGAGCSFSFSVPSTGKQLYPVTDGGSGPGPGCTPPPAPTVSTSGGTQVCDNSTVTLTAAGCSGTVLWSGGQSGASISVNAAGTYTATCTVNGCVSTPSSQVTVTACPPNSGRKYERVLYVGNSITLHGGTQFFIVNEQNPKRGMAATSPDKDYVHLMSAKHKSLNPSVDNRTLASWNMGGQLDEATGPYWEGQSTKNDIDLGRFDPVAAWKPDIVYIRLGENVTDWEITNPSQFQNRLKALIDKLISQSPGAKVVLSTAVWDKPNYDAAIRAIAAERNYPLADFSNMWPNRLINGFYAINPSIYGDAGTDNHPDDDGMAHMAEGLWNATPK